MGSVVSPRMNSPTIKKSEVARPLKIVVVTPIPTPYRDPFWEELGSRDDVSLAVIYCAGAKADRPWGDLANATNFRAVFPKSINIASKLGWGFSCFWNPDAVKFLNELQPDVVLVGGYAHLTMLRTIRFCRRQRVPWLLMSESWKERKGCKGRIKQYWLRSLLKSSVGGLPTGTLASGQLDRLKIKRDQQFKLPNVPDLARLTADAKLVRSNVELSRQELGLKNGQKTLLFAARLIPKKRPLMVIEAFAKVRKDHNLQLVILGDGPLRAEAEQLCRKLELADRVRFEGFVSPEVVHNWMSVSDVFLQPSLETWGVAPIEAAACGCQVIVSNQIGCYADVFQGSPEHRVLTQIDIATLAEAMEELIQDANSTLLDRTVCQKWLTANTHEKLADCLAAFLRGCITASGNAGSINTSAKKRAMVN